MSLKPYLAESHETAASSSPFVFSPGVERQPAGEATDHLAPNQTFTTFLANAPQASVHVGT
jgi:hypothetical protein